MLSIHQAFADRLFPGTSVLHTRLRYALFVPWLMQTAAKSANPVKKLEQLEFELTGRLKLGLTNKAASEDDTGIIGSRVYEKGKPAAQPASFSYWSALASWGVLGCDHRHSAPSRESVLEELGSERKAGSALDLDGQSLSTGPTYFQDLPLQPPALLKDPKGVTFKLPAQERQYLRNRLRSTKAPTLEDETSRESFLAALARNTVRPLEKTELWDDAAVCACVPKEDEDLIDLARHISALGGIVRAVYLAFVEQACADKKLLASRVHRDHLIQCRTEWGAEAMKADLEKLVSEGLGLEHNKLYALLEATQAWLATSAALPRAPVRKLYVDLERDRKHGRARLSGKAGASQQLRRWARSGERASTAGRLHFRWPSVSRLIRDLHE